MSIVSAVSAWHERKLGSGGALPEDKALDDLTRYVPTESITLYLASLGVLPALVRIWPAVSTPLLYVLWAILTPCIVFLVALGKHRANRSSHTFDPPVWPMTAATIAYLAWGLAIPGLVNDDAVKIVAAFCALVVSKFLALLEPIFGGKP